MNTKTRASRLSIAIVQSAEALNERMALLNLTIPLVNLPRWKVRIDEELGEFSESWLSKVETH